MPDPYPGEQECAKCEGAGCMPDSDLPVAPSCSACHGSGSVPSGVERNEVLSAMRRVLDVIEAEATQLYHGGEEELVEHVVDAIADARKLLGSLSGLETEQTGGRVTEPSEGVTVNLTVEEAAAMIRDRQGEDIMEPDGMYEAWTEGWAKVHVAWAEARGPLDFPSGGDEQETDDGLRSAPSGVADADLVTAARAANEARRALPTGDKWSDTHYVVPHKVMWDLQDALTATGQQEHFEREEAT